MVQVTVSLAIGRDVAFEVASDATGPACFVLGIRKCGSTMLNSICALMAKINTCNYVAVDNFFHANVRADEYSGDPAIAVLLHGGNVYGGFRLMPEGFAAHRLFIDGPKILMVRDPRDALVSEYFSNSFSHPLPETTGQDGSHQLMETLRHEALAAPIDAYVLKRARSMGAAFLNYQALSRSPTARVVRYEDFIFRKPELMRLIAAQFGWTIDEAQIGQIMRAVDKLPAEENPTAFVRQVKPGDHRVKLRPETIEALDRLLAPAMGLFGYSGG